MAIGKAQWQRRLKAALEVTGQEMQDLPHEWEGFAKKAAQRANHDSDTYEASEPLARSVADYFGLPVEWFTAEDFPAWLSSAGQPRQAVAGELAETLKRIDLGVQALAANAGLEQRARESGLESPPRTDSTQEGSGNG